MTSARDGLAALEHLDWNTLSCQAQPRCRNQATHMVELHVVDFCDESWLNPFGNTVGIVCERCLAAVEMDVDFQVTKLRMYGRPMCLTCNAPVQQLSDVVRERKPL